MRLNERTVLLTERSQLFINVVASVVSLTFVYCGLQTAESDLGIINL